MPQIVINCFVELSDISFRGEFYLNSDELNIHDCKDFREFEKDEEFIKSLILKKLQSDHVKNVQFISCTLTV